MATRFKLRRDTSANWQLANPILALGEPGIELDTNLIKYGDGSTPWTSLRYGGTGNLQITDTTITSSKQLVMNSGTGAQETWIATLTDPNYIQSNNAVNGVVYDNTGNIITVSSWNDKINNITGTLVTKTSGDGTSIIWQQFFETLSNMFASGLAVDSNNDVFFICGMQGEIGLLKLLGSSGAINWQKLIYNSNNTFDDNAWGIAVDSNDDVIVSGSTSTGSNNYILLFKIRGDGDINNVGNWSISLAGEVYYSGGVGITTDSTNHIYMTGFVNNTDGNTTTNKLVAVKFAANGTIVWQNTYQIPQFSFSPALSGLGIVCDNANNLYLTAWSIDIPIYLTMFKLDATDGSKIWAREYPGTTCVSVSGFTAIDKDNRVYMISTIQQPASLPSDLNGHYQRVVFMLVCYDTNGNIAWRRDLAKTQNDVWPETSQGPTSGQAIAVKDEFITICGYIYENAAYNFENEEWYTRGFVAQFDRSPKPFETDGWELSDGHDFSRFIDLIIEDTNLFTSTPVTLTINNGTIVPASFTATWQVSSIRASRTHSLGIDSDIVSVSPGGSLVIPRTTAGQITVLGGEPNTDADVWIQQVARDSDGNTYGLGGDSIAAGYGTVFKLNSAGELDWEVQLQSGSNFGPDYGGGLCVDPNNQQPVYVTGDTNNGFNVVRLDSTSGDTISVVNVPKNGNQTINVQAVNINSQGHPVVVGYIQNSKDSFNATSNSPGLPGSNVGILVANTAIFGNTAPSNNSYWYITNQADDYDSQITAVNTWLGVPATGGFGSGARFNIAGNVFLPTYDTVAIQNSGGSYHAGDNLVVDGTLVGGSHANNVAITVGNVDGSGVILDITYQGAFDSSNITLEVNTGTDFTQSDSYIVYRSDGEDAFVWSQDWSKVLGTIANDGFMAVATDSNGNIVCGGYTTNTSNSGLVTKFDQTGTRLWSVVIDDGNVNYHNVNTIAVDSMNNIIAHSLDDNSYPWITKLDVNGRIIWQVQIQSGVTYWTASGIAIDSDDNIYVSSSMTSGESMAYDLLIAKFSPNGDIIWQRDLGTGSVDISGYDGWYGGSLSISGDRYSIGGFTLAYTPNSKSDGFIADLPTDGTGTGHWQRWFYRKVEHTLMRTSNNGLLQPVEIDPVSYVFTHSTLTPRPVVNHYGVANDQHIVKLPEGGAISGIYDIVFEDGTTQNTSSQDIPQSDPVYTELNYSYNITLEDRGHHIVRSYGQVVVPTNANLPFPIGTAITIVNSNASSGSIGIIPDQSGTTTIVGVGMQYPNDNYWLLLPRGLATLLKVGTDLWYLSGGPLQDNN